MTGQLARRVCAAVCLAALWSPATWASPVADVWAISGARIVPVSGPPIDRGTVVIRDGLIAEVGAAARVPAGARVLDGSGLTVYPGLVDAFVHVEPEQRAGESQQAAARAPSRDNPPGVQPEREALDLVKPEAYEAMRSAGVTAALVVPKGGIFPGRSALVSLGGGTAAKMALRPTAALHVAFETQGGFGTYPSSLMGVVSVIRQKLLDAEHYRLAWTSYQAEPRGRQRPEPSKQLAALLPALDGALPVVMDASLDTQIRRALEIAREFSLRPVIAGGLEAWRAADALKTANAPVLLSLNFPERPADLDPETAETLRAIRARVEAPEAAARLHRAGVRFAFQSGGLKSPKQYLANAIKAVEAGLPKDAALRAMTLTPAEIFGASAQVGSIEAGKIANLVVATGDLFDRSTKIRHVFVDGERFEIQDEAPPAGQPGEQTADVTGTWTLSVDSPQGSQPATLALKQEGTTVTGTLQNQLIGTAEITSGSVSGRRLTFSATLLVQGQRFEAQITADVEGNTMKGTFVLGGQGQFGFTGTRPERGGTNEI